MGQRHLRSTVRSAARTPDAWPAWTCVLVGHRRHVRRLPVWSHDLHDRHEVRRSRHRDGRHLHRDGRHHRDASRGYHHRRVREHLGARWRTGRASCPGWDADRPDAEHRSGRLPEAVDRPEGGGHRDADRPEDGDHRSHPDGACPGRWRRGCCRDAAHPSATGPSAGHLGLPVRPDGACPGRWRRGCCRDAEHWGEAPGSEHCDASRTPGYRRRPQAWELRLQAWGPWAPRPRLPAGAPAWRHSGPGLRHSAWRPEHLAWGHSWRAWERPA